MENIRFGSTRQSKIVRQIKARISGALILALLICLLLPFSARAAVWVAPEGDTVAEAAIVMDAKSGTVLWGKNISDTYYPASITKLMTGLLVLERCDPGEQVTVTAEAVTGLERGAVSIGLSEGDVLTVEELLYAMLLRSANDAANVLAVHVSGSIEAFAGEMTARAAELGCRNTIFRNPSGLTTPENLTTAYDMALIGAACSRNPEFLAIEAEQSHQIGPTAKNPEGFTVRAEHKMIVKGTAYTDPRVIGGKTGFIKASGNTLVTIAEEESGMRLVAFVLKDKNPDHYKDTKMLLDFGFQNFENYEIRDPASVYACEERLIADKITEKGRCHIVSYEDAVLTIPAGADPSEIQVGYEYNLAPDAPAMAVAELVFRYADVRVGSAYLLNDHEADIAIELEKDAWTDEQHPGISIRNVVYIAAAAAVLILILTAVLISRHKKQRDQERRERLLENRRRRLEELNMSEEEFEELVGSFKNKGSREET